MSNKSKSIKGLGPTALAFFLGAAVLLCVLLFLGQLPWLNDDDDVKKHVSGRLIGEQIHEISELSTLEYDYTYVGKFKDSRNINFFIKELKIPLTEKNFIGSFDGTIKYGVDLEKIDEPKINNNKKTITIGMPEVVINSHEIDFDSINYWDKTNNLFNPIQPEDSDQFEKGNMKSAEQQALDRKILTKVQKHTSAVISMFIKKMYPEYEDYEIICEYPKQKNIKKSKDFDNE